MNATQPPEAARVPIGTAAHEAQPATAQGAERAAPRRAVDAPAAEWHLRQVPLRFQLGDLTLFSVELPLCVRAVRLSDRETPVDLPRPPADPACPQAAGYMARSLPVARELPTLEVDGGFIRYVTLQYPHCYIDLSIGVDGYRANFSAKTRSTIQRKVRKFQDHCGGKLDWRTYRTPESMAEFHRLAREVSRTTYQERLLDAGIPDGASFVQEMEQLAAGNRVRAYILFHGDRPVSYLYCPVQERVLIYAYLGYHPDYMKLSVGTVLQWLALEQLLEEREFDFFDFTEGQSDHKRLFSTHEQRCANVMFVRHTWWRWQLLRAHDLTNRFSKAVGEYAERRGIKSTLRKWLRFGLRDRASRQ